MKTRLTAVEEWIAAQFREAIGPLTPLGSTQHLVMAGSTVSGVEFVVKMGANLDAERQRLDWPTIVSVWVDGVRSRER